MAANVSEEQSKKILLALTKTYNHLDKELVKAVAYQYGFDSRRAGNALAEIDAQRINSDKMSKTNQENNSNPPGNYMGPTDLYDGIIRSIKEGYRVLVLMRGLPGSGKTTLATHILHKSIGQVNKDKFIFSADQYSFRPGSNIYNIDQVDEPYQWNQKRCFSKMKKGVSPIIIDDVNLEVEDMKVYCVMAVQFGYLIEIAVPLTSWAFNTRILTFKNNHGASEWKIKEMHKIFQKHNITTKDLYDKLSLQDSHRRPQLRNYPPLQSNLQHTAQMDVAAVNFGVQAVPPRQYSKTEKTPQLPPNFQFTGNPSLQRLVPQMQQNDVVATYSSPHGAFQRGASIKNKERQLPGVPQFADNLPSQRPSQYNIVSGYSGAQQVFQKEYPIEKRKPELPVEYVHKFEVRREVVPPKKSTPVVGQLINISNETKSERPSVDDLLDLVSDNLDNLIPKMEAPTKSVDAGLFAKQLRDNNELLTKLMTYFQESITKDQKSTTGEKISTTEGVKTEALGQTMGSENEIKIQKKSAKTDSKQIQSSSPYMGTLNEQTDMLKEMFSKIRDAESKKERLAVTGTKSVFMDFETKNEDTSDPIAKMISEREKFQFEGFNTLPTKSEVSQQLSSEKQTFFYNDLDKSDDFEINSLLDTLEALEYRNNELRKMVTKIQEPKPATKKSELGSIGVFAESKISNVAEPFQRERFHSNEVDISYRSTAVNPQGSRENRTTVQSESNDTYHKQVKFSTDDLQALQKDNEQLWDMLSKM